MEEVVKPRGRPRISSSAEIELANMQKQLDAFESQIKSLTLDRMNEAPKLEEEPQTKLSNSEIKKAKTTVLSPIRTIGCQDKFNENFRKQYEYMKQRVDFICENKEIIGESVKPWTKPFAGVPAEQWDVPVNTPVTGPRYLAEQLNKCTYHTLIMDESTTPSNRVGDIGYGTTQYGVTVVDKTVSRIEAYPVRNHTSVFMGAQDF